MLKHQGTRPLSTKRLYLRQFVPSDAAAVYENWASDPQVARFLTWRPHSTLKVTKDMVENWCTHYTKRTYHWAVVWRETGAVVGSVSLTGLQDAVGSGNLAYALSQQFWGRGVIPEAAGAILRYLFGEIGFSVVRAQYDEQNSQSGRVLEKLSMSTPIFCQKEFLDAEGIPRRMLECELTRERWELLQIRKAYAHEVGELGVLYAALSDSLVSAPHGPGWMKHVYPRTATAQEAFLKGELYVAVREGQVEGSVILNTRQESAYQSAEWSYPAGGLRPGDLLPPALVVHTLAVHPRHGGKGVGKALLAFAEEEARRLGCPAIRLDTYEKNLPAIRLYEGCGYQYAGRIDLGLMESFGLDWFYAFEKQVSSKQREESVVSQVVAALIWREDRFLICQRPAHKARGCLWEFVGGKVEPGETGPQALMRECREELAVSVSVGEVYWETVHEYPDLTVHLTLYRAAITEGAPQLLEHTDLRWITPEEISDYSFCPADVGVLEKLRGC